ncbi:MAG TPA: VOC family protein [Egibacteraceae bacterium]|nr:VOC family protein [Egibacteraceae bacterium]
MITRLNHAVLFVRDVRRSVDFYTRVLGFRVVPMAPTGMDAEFLQAPGSSNDHDLGLFGVGDSAQPSAAGRGSVGLYHLAWEVDTLDALEGLHAALTEADALTGATDHGTTKSLYGRDPDGLQFELAWIVPASQLTAEALAARSTIAPLDLSREKARYGADVRGGVGVSQPVST